MQMPISAYGTNFALVPFAGAQYSEYTILPAYDGTDVSRLRTFSFYGFSKIYKR